MFDTNETGIFFNWQNWSPAIQSTVLTTLHVMTVFGLILGHYAVESRSVCSQNGNKAHFGILSVGQKLSVQIC